MYRTKIINRNSATLKTILFSTLLFTMNAGFTVTQNQSHANQMNKQESGMGYEWKNPKVHAAFEREMKELFRPAVSRQAIRTLRTIDKDIKSGKKVDLSFTTKIEPNQLIQTIHLKGPGAMYTETTTNNEGKKSIILLSHPGNASRTISYENIDAAFRKASENSVKEAVKEQMTTSNAPKREKAAALRIVRNWHPMESFKGVAEAIYKNESQRKMQFYGTIHNNVLEGKLTYYQGPQENQIVHKTIKESIRPEMLNEIRAQDLPHMLAHMIFLSILSDLEKSSIHQMVSKHIEHMHAELESKIKGIKK